MDYRLLLLDWDFAHVMHERDDWSGLMGRRRSWSFTLPSSVVTIRNALMQSPTLGRASAPLRYTTLDVSLDIRGSIFAVLRPMAFRCRRIGRQEHSDVTNIIGEGPR